jgi:outer membrane protein TolC
MKRSAAVVPSLSIIAPPPIIPALLISCLLAGAVPLHAVPARDAPPPAIGTESLALSLDEAVQRAIAAAPRLRALEARVRAAKQAERAARAGRIPTVDLAAGYSRHSHVPELTVPQPGGGSLAIFPDLPDRYTSRLQAALPLYTGGRLTGTIEAAGHERDAATSDSDSGLLDLALETRTVYWSLVTALETEKVLRDGLAAYVAHQKEAEDRLELGLAARNDVLAVQVEREQAALSLLRAGHAVEVAAADLARLIDPGDSAGPPPRLAPRQPLDPPPAPPGSTATLIPVALESRPDRRAAAARLRVAEDRVRVARAARRPSAGLIAGYTVANPNRDILPLADDFEATWDASVLLSFTVADGGRAAAEVARAEADLEAARHLLDEFDRVIRFEVTRRALDLATAIAALPVAARGREAAEENRRVTQDRYREGLIPSSERLDAETAWMDAGLDQIGAAVRAHLAHAALDRAVGAPVAGAGP